MASLAFGLCGIWKTTNPGNLVIGFSGIVIIDHDIDEKAEDVYIDVGYC